VSTGRIESVIVTAVLCAMGVAGLVSLAAKPDTRDINRAPAEFPGVQLDVFDPLWRVAWRDYLADKLVLRRPFRALNAAIEDDLFNDAANARVIQGEGEWLFLDDAFSALIPAAGALRDPAPIAAEVRAALDALDAAGMDARLAFAPHKASIEADRLSEAVRHRAVLAQAQSEAVRAALAAAPGVIDLHPVLSRARAEAGRPVYLPRDSHWNDLGARAAAHAVVESIEPGLWEDAAARPPVALEYQPDLPRLQGRPETRERPVIEIRRAGVRTQRRPAAEPGLDVWRSESEGPPLGPPLVMIADSYGEAVAPMLAPWFSEVRFVRLSAFDPERHRDVFEGAGAVYVQIVERHMFMGPPHGPRGLAERIATALETQAPAAAGPGGR